MKYKKYIILLLLTLVIGINKTYAINKEQIKQDLDIKLSKIILINADVDCSLLGDKNDEGSWHFETNSKGEKIKVVDRPASIRYLVNQILTYVRIIVPILIILLGSLDFAKAVLQGKEEEMKKIQKKFLMRIVAGIAVFFAPVIVNLVMSLAEIVWEGLGYNNCGL